MNSVRRVSSLCLAPIGFIDTGTLSLPSDCPSYLFSMAADRVSCQALTLIIVTFCMVNFQPSELSGEETANERTRSVWTLIWTIVPDLSEKERMT